MSAIDTFHPSSGNGKLVKLPISSSEIPEIYQVEGIHAINPRIKIKKTMTVLKLANGELTIINAMRLDEQTEKDLVALGKIANVVRMATAHGADDPYYASKFECAMWACSPVDVGGEKQKSWGERTVTYQEFSESSPPPCVPGARVLTIPAKKNFAEAMFYFPEMSLLIVCDFFMNCEPKKGIKLSDINLGWVANLISRTLGFNGTIATPPVIMKSLVKSSDEAHQFNGKLMDLEWDNVIFGHGNPVIGGAKVARREFLISVKWPAVSHEMGVMVASGGAAAAAAAAGAQQLATPPSKEKARQGCFLLGDEVPNFEADSTFGKIKFHEFLGDSWGVLFSHPADFTPVCTTELNAVAKYFSEFEKRNVKVAAVSCDPVSSHKEWTKDVLAYDTSAGKSLPYPIIADPNRELAQKLGMLDAVAKDSAGMPLTARAVFVFGPDKKLKLSILYPATTGRNFDEIVRVIDSLQLTAMKRLATPANWVQGDECVIGSSVSQEEANKVFPGYRTVDLPSKKPYLRFTKCE